MTLGVECFILFADIVLFTAYLVAVLVRFGIPVNMSMTYYMYRQKNEVLRLLFPCLLVFLCISCGSLWIKICHRFELAPLFVALVYVTIVCLIAVAASAQYQKTPTIIYFHYTCAIIASACTTLWLLFVSYKVMHVALGILLISTCLGLITKTLKSCTLFWLEIAGFYALMITLLIIYFVPIQL